MRPRSPHVALACVLLLAGLGAVGCGSESAQQTTSATTVTTTTATTTSTGSTTGTTETTSTGTTTRVKKRSTLEEVSFRTAGTKVVCGLDARVLVCFNPANGATVRLDPTEVPKAAVEAANRGVTSLERTATVLALGHSVTVATYQCSARKDGAVRCENGDAHGFQLGGDAVYRF
jgi:Family of unknown function (DUF6636)